VRIERTFRYPMGIADSYAMAVTQGFQEKKCADAGALSWTIDVTHSGAAVTVKTKRKLPTTTFPSLIRKFVPSGVTSTETIVWGPAEADGSRTAQLSVDFHGAPATMKGTVRLAPDGPDMTDVFVDAHFDAHVPLLGGRVERLAAPIIIGVIDCEEVTAKAWAAGER
jgi:hypothetical protein